MTIHSCCAVQDVINWRLCSVCGLYLASIKESSSHKQVHKDAQTNENDPPPPPEPRRRRPQRIAARRQRELCILVSGIREAGVVLEQGVKTKHSVYHKVYFMVLCF